MPISIGTRLGPYEVVAPIGAGGMGEVWRARDTRLERSVAIKLLPAEFATDAQFRLRFEREAKTISQLNDPHICTVYDVGHEDGRDYLVMEYLDGESLADRIARGPLPIADVIRYGIDIATALERAHAAGIVHRDLKPGNVMLTKSGAKLLDFGLAKGRASILTPQSSAVETEHQPLTKEGTILGTFQYMAPEQLEGVEADARTDIFALGTTLYEMATGRRAFDGRTKTSLIAAIVDRDPPPMSSIQPLTPRAFERVVMTCLAKDPAERWQSAHDVRLELEWLRNEEREAVAPRKQSRLAWTIAALMAIVALAITGLFVRSRFATRDAPVIRTSILPPPGTAFNFFLEPGGPEIAPDGKKIAFLATTPGGERTLWVRSLDSPTAKELSGTQRAAQIFWSPDSRSIAFWSDGALKRIEIAGGPPVTIASMDIMRGGSWSPDGTILLGRVSGGIVKVPAAGGTPVEVTHIDLKRRETSHRWPHFLPDGKHFFFLSGPVAAESLFGGEMIGVASTENSTRQDVVRATSNAAYYDGWIVFTRERLLTAQRLDPKTFAAVGDPVPLRESQVEYDSATSRAFFSISPDGSLLYQTGEGLKPTELSLADRSGKRVRTIGDPQLYGQIAFSNDGRFIAYGIVPRTNIWVLDVARGVNTRLTFAKAHDYAPVWSPDGQKMVFSSDRAGKGYDLYLKDLRTGTEELLVTSENNKLGSSWSRDGKFLFYTEANGGLTNSDVLYYSFADGKTHPYVATTFYELGAKISPDGKWVAYQSNETSPWQVYLAPFPPTGVKWQVSQKGGLQPRWSGSGREIFFRTLNQLIAAPVKLGETPEIGVPVHLFDVQFGVANQWDVSPDGRTFLLNERQGSAPPPAPLTLVQNFGTELKRVAAASPAPQ